MRQQEIEEALERHSNLFDMVEQIAQRHTDLLLQMTRTYFELLEKVGQQKIVMVAQKNLINQCMKRIMQLEARSILGSFNQRLEQIESRLVSTPATHEMGVLEQRVERLESWLYTHDYNYFQEQEREQAIKHDTIVFKKVDDWMRETNGNSSFEEYEMHHPDPSYVEQEDIP